MSGVSGRGCFLCVSVWLGDWVSGVGGRMVCLCGCAPLSVAV